MRIRDNPNPSLVWEMLLFLLSTLFMSLCFCDEDEMKERVNGGNRSTLWIF